MDVAAIVASVGSFVVSERVIKAKATFLFGLGCTVCYDLFIHSNDAATLRVYRGEISFKLSNSLSQEYFSHITSCYILLMNFRAWIYCTVVYFICFLFTIMEAKRYSLRRTHISTRNKVCCKSIWFIKYKTFAYKFKT